MDPRVGKVVKNTLDDGSVVDAKVVGVEVRDAKLSYTISYKGIEGGGDLVDQWSIDEVDAQVPGVEKVIMDEERSDEMTALALGTKAARARSFVQDVPPSKSRQ